MTDRRAVGMLRQLGDATRVAMPDAALLAWFAAERDEAAFAELVRRHGPTVLGVCRRVTRHPQDAEDAFQAVFLVLATKAGTLARPELLGNWLYGVAYRVARRARRSAARRREREGQVATMTEPVTRPPEPVADLAAVIDDALAELPERFRAAILLCDLHELPRSEAATRLGIPEGTLSSRLAAGRKQLADRLARRGITAPAAALAVALGGSATAVPPSLAVRAVSTAVAWVSGGVVPAVLRQLATEGGARMTRMIGWAAAACTAMGLAVGAVAAWPGDDTKKPTPPAREAKAGNEQPAAKPAVEGPKPAATRRVRLVKTFDLFGGSNFPFWSSDGSLLAVEVDDKVAVIDTRKSEFRNYYDIGTSAFVVGKFLQFVPGKQTLVTLTGWSGRINEQPQLRFWDIPTGLVGNVKLARTTDLAEENGAPRWFLPDGKSIVCARRLQVAGQETPDVSYRLISADTGELLREVARVDHNDVAGGLSPDGKTLVVVASKAKTVTIESWDVATGKRAWKRDLKAEEPRLRGVRIPYPVIVSPDGKTVAITFYPTLEDQPKAGRHILTGELRLFDAATGKDGPRLEGQAPLNNLGYSFSHDGR
ncbi:MAG TPA: sigma-70 family RNA polymerase sigma factor, partial [Fimbriiglobus sp.]|nr:sigma-70 family RNA polymerase sigma factor [Fimbriiglobus sp.]